MRRQLESETSGSEYTKAYAIRHTGHNRNEQVEGPYLMWKSLTSDEILGLWIYKVF